MIDVTIYNLFFFNLNKNALDRINQETAIRFVLKCCNFDGGFGCIPGAESHSGQVFYIN